MAAVVTSSPSPQADLNPSRVGPGRGRRRLLANAGLLLVGCVAGGAGAGLGIRHLLKEGWSRTSAVGVLLLVLGIWSLAVVLRRSWRSLPGWRRLAVLPLVLGVLLPTSSVGLAVAYTQVPRTQLGDVTPADHGQRFEDVGFRTSDGAALSGWLIEPRNGAAVVLLHGAGSTRTATLAQAAVLADHGFGVLMVDARGQGRSGGTGMDLGWFGDRDVEAAVGYLRQRPGVEAGRIGLVGMSMGGEEAVGAAPVVDVAAVVAEGATARTAGDKAEWLPGGVAGAVQRALDRLTFAVTDLLTPASPPTALRAAVERAAGTEFLLVTAGAEPDEARAAEVLRAAAPARVTVWDVPGSPHTGGLAQDPRGWEQRVVGFLEEWLT
jgi:uncharacterized protein